MTDRNPGFYWVRYGSSWEVAEWSGKQWLATGFSGVPFVDNDLEKIGQRIEPPDARQ